MGDSLPAINVDLLTNSVNNAVNGGGLLPPHSFILPPPPPPTATPSYLPASGLSTVLPAAGSLDQTTVLSPQSPASVIMTTVPSASSGTVINSEPQFPAGISFPAYMFLHSPSPANQIPSLMSNMALPVPMSPVQIPFFGFRPGSAGLHQGTSVSSLKQQPLFSYSPAQIIQIPSQNIAFSPSPALSGSTVASGMIPSASVTVLPCSKPQTVSASPHSICSLLVQSSAGGKSAVSLPSQIHTASVDDGKSDNNKNGSECHDDGISCTVVPDSSLHACKNIRNCEETSLSSFASAVTVTTITASTTTVVTSRMPTAVLTTFSSSLPDCCHSQKDASEENTVHSHTDCESSHICCLKNLCSCVDDAHYGHMSTHDQTASDINKTSTISSNADDTNNKPAGYTTVQSIISSHHDSYDDNGCNSTNDKMCGHLDIPSSDCRNESHGLTDNNSINSSRSAHQTSSISSQNAVSSSADCVSSSSAVSMSSCPPPVFIMLSLRLPVMPSDAATAHIQNQNKGQGACNSSRPGGTFLNTQMAPFPPFPLLLPVPFFPPPLQDKSQFRPRLPFPDTSANSSSMANTNLPLMPVSFPQGLPLPPLPLQLPVSLPFLPLPPPLPLSSGSQSDITPLPPLVLQPAGSGTSLPLLPFFQPSSTCAASFPFTSMISTVANSQHGQFLPPLPSQPFTTFVKSGIPLPSMSTSNLPLPVPLLLPPPPVQVLEGSSHSSGSLYSTTSVCMSSQAGNASSESVCFHCPSASKNTFPSPSFPLTGFAPLPPLPSSSSSFAMLPPLPLPPTNSSVDFPCPLSLALPLPPTVFSLPPDCSGASQLPPPPLFVSVAGQPMVPPFSGTMLPPMPFMPDCETTLPAPSTSMLIENSPKGSHQPAGAKVDNGECEEESERSSDSDEEEMTIDETGDDEGPVENTALETAVNTDNPDTGASNGRTTSISYCYAQNEVVPPIMIQSQSLTSQCHFVEKYETQFQSLHPSSVSTSQLQYVDAMPSSSQDRQDVEMAIDQDTAGRKLPQLPLHSGINCNSVVSESYPRNNSQMFSPLFTGTSHCTERCQHSFPEETQRLHHFPVVTSSSATPGGYFFPHHHSSQLMPHTTSSYHDSQMLRDAENITTLQPLSESVMREQLSGKADLDCCVHCHTLLPGPFQSGKAVNDRHPSLSVNVNSVPFPDHPSFYPVPMDTDGSFVSLLPMPDGQYTGSLPPCAVEAQHQPAVNVQPIGDQTLLSSQSSPLCSQPVNGQKRKARELFQTVQPACTLSQVSHPLPNSHLQQISFHSPDPQFDSLHPNAVFSPLSDHNGSAQKLNRGEQVAASMSGSCHLHHNGSFSGLSAEDGKVHMLNKDAVPLSLPDTCRFHGSLNSLRAGDFNFPAMPEPVVSVDHPSQTILPSAGYSPPGLSNHGLSPNLFSPGTLASVEHVDAGRDGACLNGATSGVCGGSHGLTTVSTSVLDMLLLKADQDTVDKGSVTESTLLPNTAAVYNPPAMVSVVQSTESAAAHTKAQAVSLLQEPVAQSITSCELDVPLFSGQFCVECNKLCTEPCKHGLTQYQHISDSPLLTRARATVPSCLTLRRSQVVGHLNNTGVFCKTTIAAKAVFGPMQGKWEAGVTNTPGSFSQWKIFFKKGFRILDISDENVSNWMIFVKPACNAMERNVIAFQRGSDLMFITTCDIQTDTELRFWFAPDYAKMICGKSRFSQFCPYCPVCSTVFFDRQQQRQHTKLAHGKSAAAKKWPCSVCSAQFRLHSKLTEHVMICHMHLKPWVCSICGKEFADQRNFSVHKAMHEGVRKFGCDICGMRFMQKAHLQSHQSTHTKVKAVQCRYCDKRFVRATDMRQHELQHTQGQTLNCSHCSKTFHRVELLRRHVKTVHQNQRDYLCERCSKAFHTKYKLLRHAKFCFDSEKDKALSQTLGSTTSSLSLPSRSKSSQKTSVVSLPSSSQSSALLNALNSVPIVVNSAS